MTSSALSKFTGAVLSYAFPVFAMLNLVAFDIVYCL